jgi:hypothetical protein
MFNGCCWPRFQLRSLGRLGSLARRFLTSTHLAPSFCEPGRGSHPDILMSDMLQLVVTLVRNP